MKMNDPNTNSLLSLGRKYVFAILKERDVKQSKIVSITGAKKAVSAFLAFSMLLVQVIPAGLAEGAKALSPDDIDLLRPTVQVAQNETKVQTPSETVPSGSLVPPGALAPPISADDKADSSNELAKKEDLNLLRYPDGTQIRITYDRKDPTRPILMVATSPTGRELTLNLKDFEGNVDVAVIGLALKDLLKESSGLAAKDSVRLTAYEGNQFFMCTQMTGNNICSGNLRLTLESEHTRYRYDINQSYRTDDLNRPIRSSYRQEIKNVTSETILTEEVRAREAVVQSLIERFGFSKEEIAEWLKKGLISIVFTMQKSKPPVITGATVQFAAGFDLGLKPGEVNPFDPSAGNSAPENIVFNISVHQDTIYCITAPCPQPEPRYSIDNISFQLNGLNYKDEPIIRHMFYAPGQSYPLWRWSVTDASGKEVRRITYLTVFSSLYINREIPDLRDPTRFSGAFLVNQIIIENLDGSLGDFATREVNVITNSEGFARITSLVDKDKAGQILVRSEFDYQVFQMEIICLPNQKCKQPAPQYFLISILRTNGSGQQLSVIRFVNEHPVVGPIDAKPMPPVGRPFAQVIFPDGQQFFVQYKDLTDLLKKVDKLEKENKELPEVTAARQAVIQSLMDRFGFTKEKVDEWLKKGLISIAFTMQKSKPPVITGATVTFNKGFDLGLQPGEVNPFDPSAGNTFPREIHFDIEHHKLVCIKAPCPDLIHVNGISFEMNGLNYKEVIIPSLAIYPPHAPGERYPVRRWSVTDKNGKEVRRITYFAIYPGGVIFGKPVVGISKEALIVIENLDGSMGDFAVREVFTAGSREGFARISALVDKDKNGKVLARSDFKYLVAITHVLCLPNMKCVPPEPRYILDSILRTDADGKKLSEIRFNVVRPFPTPKPNPIPLPKPVDGSGDVKPGVPGKVPGVIEPAPIMPPYDGLSLAQVMLANGRQVAVRYSDLTDLLRQVQKLELANRHLKPILDPILKTGSLQLN